MGRNDYLIFRLTAPGYIDKTVRVYKSTKSKTITYKLEVDETYNASEASSNLANKSMTVNVKDGIVRLLKKDNITRGVNVSIKDDSLIINLHIIVAYGVSISAVADNLISNVRYKVEEFTNMKVNKINVIVEGVRITE